MEMENSMNAIISIIMIGVGFVNGIGWSNLFRLQQIGNLQQEIYSKKCLNDDYLEIIKDLENQNKKLKGIVADNEEKLEAIKLLVNIPTYLPPPNTPLLRSDPVLRSSNNNSDITPICSNSTD